MIVAISVDSAKSFTFVKDHSLVLRIILFQDTSWVHSGSIRRIYTNVVRATAHNDTLSLGIPFQFRSGELISYAFDVGALQKDLLVWQDIDQIARSRHVDRNIAESLYSFQSKPYTDILDWKIDRNRLQLVVMIQDFTTGDIVAAARIKILRSISKTKEG